MSEIRLRHEGTPVVIRLEPADDGLTATVDGTAHLVTRIATGAREQRAGSSAETVVFDLDGRPVRATVVRDRDRVLVALDGRVYAFDRGDAAAGGGGHAGSGAVVAPMPGKIIRVLVEPGATVTAGDAVVVLEAMKMESTLTAEIAGTVQRIACATGDRVDGGAVLLVIEPAA